MRHQESDFLQTELSRFSDWIQFTDQKAGFIAVFYSAILGYLITKRDVILSNLFICNETCDIWPLLFIGLIILLAMGIYQLFFTVVPKLKNTNTKESLFYFGTVAALRLEDFQIKFENMTDEEARKQLVEQIHTNSMIANTKMVSVKKSAVFLFCSGILVFLLFII